MCGAHTIRDPPIGKQWEPPIPADSLRHGANAGPFRNFIAIGNVRTLATIPIELPAMLGTANGFPHDPTALAHMNPQVRTVGGENLGPTRARAKEHQLVAEAVNAFHLARIEFFAPSDGIPTVGNAGILVDEFSSRCTITLGHCNCSSFEVVTGSASALARAPGAGVQNEPPLQK